MDRVADPSDLDRMMLAVSLAQTPATSPTRTLQAPPPDPFEAWVAVIAIVLALAAGILGYRIIRGGRGL